MATLYYSPGACSLAVHIVLRELELPFDLVRVDLRGKLTETGADFRALNPKGYVPALTLDDGTLLTEGAVIVQVLADQHPARKLVPKAGTIERVRLQEWLHFIATELHKGMSPLYAAKANDEYKSAVRERLRGRFGLLEQQLAPGEFVMGERFTVVDPYAYYVARSWMKHGPSDLSELPHLRAFVERMHTRPTVRAALTAEGLT